MSIIEIADTVDALRKAKDDLVEAFKNPSEYESFLGMMAILSDECAAFHALFEEEALKHPTPEGAEW